MAKQYYRRGTPSDPNSWVKMSGKEFYQFVNDPKNRNRHFIDMGDIVLESPESIYREYEAEMRHSKYIERQKEGIDVLSLQSRARDDSLTLLETVADQLQDVESEAIRHLLIQQLYAAIQALPNDEYQIIYALYLRKPSKTVRKLSEESGIPFMTLQNRKHRILQRLKQLLENNAQS